MTVEERLTLQQLAVNHQCCDIRTRAMGLSRLFKLSRPDLVAAELGVYQISIYGWASVSVASVRYWVDMLECALQYFLRKCSAMLKAVCV